ncbi:SDR family NAD(P)-dependent oxidoreductase [Mesorhizobium sp. WSM4904]|uniref:SDR family NAD(P)-dependent oxidoreductase n=1 Tax=Mesorhizobium sp. WSM4904 TaxID=3038545 RepID=UPI002418A54F|nr:SDR family NAD(P)-dependent oxidoreductase [Mesorhizobium sp. WSM4904]WFP60477.1 SDR family NAD(P)-dependent oxidoreductase [Mesorhizobium sp. WSM4904]
MDLQKQTAVIVGGTGDIGHATAKLFVKAGARVIITGRQRERAAARAQLLGPLARGDAVSPADEADLRHFFGEIGTFDHLVLTLGTQSITLPFAQLNDGHMRDAMDSKYMAYTRTLRAALGHVQQSVTWLTSAAARTALPGLSNYAAPNGALHAMMGPLAMELAP